MERMTVAPALRASASIAARPDPQRRVGSSWKPTSMRPGIASCGSNGPAAVLGRKPSQTPTPAPTAATTTNKARNRHTTGTVPRPRLSQASAAAVGGDRQLQSDLGAGRKLRFQALDHEPRARRLEEQVGGRLLR